MSNRNFQDLAFPRLHVNVFAQINCRLAFLNNTPGSRWDSHNTWNPLQTPSTIPPFSAKRTRGCISGLKRAIDHIGDNRRMKSHPEEQYNPEWKTYSGPCLYAIT